MCHASWGTSRLCSVMRVSWVPSRKSRVVSHDSKLQGDRHTEISCVGCTHDTRHEYSCSVQESWDKSWETETGVVRQRPELWDRRVVRPETSVVRQRQELREERVVKSRESWVILARVIRQGLWGVDVHRIRARKHAWVLTMSSHHADWFLSHDLRVMAVMTMIKYSWVMWQESWVPMMSTHESCDWSWWVLMMSSECSWWLVTGLVSTRESCDKTQYSSWLLIRILVRMSTESCHMTHEYPSWVLMTLARVLQKRVKIHESEVMSQTCLLSATTRTHTQMYAPSSTHVNVAQPAHTHTSMQTHTHAPARTPGEAVWILNLWPRERWCCF